MEIDYPDNHYYNEGDEEVVAYEPPLEKWSFTVYMNDNSCQAFEELHTKDTAIAYLQEILATGLARTYENGSVEAWSPHAIKRVRIQLSDPNAPEAGTFIEFENPAKKPRKKK